MKSWTEIPAYNPEEFAEAEDSTHRDTRVPAFDVSLLARAADVEASEVIEAGFDLAAVPVLGAMSTGGEAIDHRAAFLMLNIDGRSSFDTVIRLSHVPEAEARIVLANMLTAGLITIRGENEPVKHKSGMWSRETDRRVENDSECWTFAVY